MDDQDRQSALMQALTTEHFVLQTAASGTIAEAAARASLFVFALSSALVAMGFASRSRELFVPFVATVLPALFLLGVFTVVRLVDTTIENMQYLGGIARIRAHYRTLGPEAAARFAPRTGRWPEGPTPSLAHGTLVAFFGTSASMVAFIDAVVAGAAVALLAPPLRAGGRAVPPLALGVGAAAVLMGLFLAYQRWRFARADVDADANADVAPGAVSGGSRSTGSRSR